MSGSSPAQASQIRASLSFAEAKPHLLPLLPDGLQTHPADLKKLEYLWPDLTAEAETLPEVAQAAHFLLTDITQDYTTEHTHALLQAHHLLHDIYDTLSAVTEWTPDILNKVLANLTEQASSTEPTLRTALTAQTGSLSLSRIMTALGQNECLRRLKAALHHVHENGGHHH